MECVRHSDTAVAWTYTWDTVTAADGFHSVEVRAYDFAGNVAKHRITVSVLNHRPLTVTNVTPTGYTAVPLQLGDCYYRDRLYTLQSIPSILRAQVWIKTGNADKSRRERDFFAVPRKPAGYRVRGLRCAGYAVARRGSPPGGQIPAQRFARAMCR